MQLTPRWHWLNPAIVWLVWLGCVLQLGWFVRTYSSPWPYHDEWYYVPQVTGHEPLSVQWFWAQHNEHRIPLAKLTFVPILRLAGYDYRAMQYFNVGVAATAVALLLVGIRLARGRTLLSDALYPVISLSLNPENHLWGFQVAFFQYLWLTAGLFALAWLRQPGAARPIWLLWLGLICWLLPTTGGPGIGLMPGLCGWLGYEIFVAVRAKQRRSAVLAGIVLVGCVVWIIAYFNLGYTTMEVAKGQRTLWALVRAMLLMLGNLFGFFQQFYHQPAANEVPWFGVAALGLLIAGLLLAVRNRHELGEQFWICLALAIALTGLCAGIAFSRFEGILATAPRYSTLAVPWFWLLALVAAKPDGSWRDRLWRGLLLSLAVGCFAIAFKTAKTSANVREQTQHELRRLVTLKAPISVLANTVCRVQESPEKRYVEQSLAQLQQAGAKSTQPLGPEIAWNWTALPATRPEPIRVPQVEVRLPLAQAIQPQALRLRFTMTPGYSVAAVFARAGPGRPVVWVRWLMNRNLDAAEQEAILWVEPNQSIEELGIVLYTPNQTLTLLQMEQSQR